MADSEVKVIISGDSSSAVAAMSQASTVVKESAIQMKESLDSVGEAFEGIQSSFLAFGALLAGGGIFRETIKATQEWTESAIDLSKELGVSTETASAYHVAIQEVGGSTSDFDAATKGLTRQLRTHESALNAVGVKTRDVNGTMLDTNTILFNAIAAVNSYKDGFDRTAAAQEIFGRGVSATSAILRLQQDATVEAAKTAARLNLIVGEDAVAAFEANRKAFAETALQFQGMQIQIGNELIPIINALSEVFSDSAGPAASVFGQVIKEISVEVLRVIGAFKEWGAIIDGIKSGNSLSAIYQQIGDIERKTDEAVAKIREAKTAMEDWGAMDASSWDSKPKGGKSYKQPAKDAGDGRLAAYKLERTQQAQLAGDFDQKDLAADEAFWQAKLALITGATEKDKNLRTQINTIIAADEKKAHDAQIKMAEEGIKAREALDLGALTARQTALEQALALGKITQAQEVAGLIQIENEKYAIEKKALDDRLALMDLDLAAQQKLDDQEKSLAQTHAAAVQKVINKAALDQQKTWDSLFSSMRSGFASTISSFMNGTASLGATIKGLFSDIGNSIIQMIANMAAQWLETSIMQQVVSKTSIASIITGLSAQAAAGAFAATAAIPYIGPELAPAAAALAMADVQAFQSVAAASGGFDIPAGMNPVTQLHAQEMVLPAKYAQVIRGMAVGQGGGAGGSMTVNAIDARSFAKALGKGGASSPLAKGLRRLNKGFVGR